MIVAKNLSFSYQHQTILHDVSLSLCPGELVCLVGANGSGKTTLLSLFAGLLTPFQGTITLNDQSITTLSRRDIAQQISFLSQNYIMTMPFPVKDIVMMGRYPFTTWLASTSKEDLALANQAMTQCHVDVFADKSFTQLSTGEQRRVLLAQAFCQNTPLLFFDEPTASLDPSHAITLFSTIQNQVRTKNRTALITTHDLTLASRFADRVILLHDQTICLDGDPLSVLSSSEAETALDTTLHISTLPKNNQPFVMPW